MTDHEKGWPSRGRDPKGRFVKATQPQIEPPQLPAPREGDGDGEFDALNIAAGLPLGTVWGIFPPVEACGFSDPPWSVYKGGPFSAGWHPGPR